MEKDTQKILRDYEGLRDKYETFNNKCKSLITELLDENNIKYHQITNRVKSRERLQGKIIKKSHKYSNLSDITDIAGLRIITYFEDEVERIAQIINSEFNIDIDNSIDKRELDADRFGYRSLHYVISLSRKRGKLPEYHQYSSLKLEIQIRTILQHSWAEIEHDIGYKGELEIPLVAKRSFSRIAALLETADIEFARLKDILKNYERKVEVDIVHKPELVLLDQASLYSYIKNSRLIEKIDLEISSFIGVPIMELDMESSTNEILNRLKNVGITSIKELDESIEENSKKLIEFIKVDMVSLDFTPKAIAVAIAIHYLDKFLLEKNASVLE